MFDPLLKILSFEDNTLEDGFMQSGASSMPVERFEVYSGNKSGKHHGLRPQSSQTGLSPTSTSSLINSAKWTNTTTLPSETPRTAPVMSPPHQKNPSLNRSSSGKHPGYASTTTKICRTTRTQVGHRSSSKSPARTGSVLQFFCRV